MPMPKHPLILVDGSSYLFRAYHALPPLTNSRGEPTGAVYGVVNMLRRLHTDYDTPHIAVVFDTKGKTFRDELFAEYKANREKMPDDLASQIAPLHDLVRALGYPLLQKAGVEADDVIGTLAQQAAAAGQQVIISTGDKDMAQLVNAQISLVNTMTGKSMDREGVKEKFDVWPEQIIDYLALVGDSSDNIPGVPKVGAKTAAKWLGEHQNLETIVAQADTIKGKVGESLRASLDQLKLSHELATIRCDVELEITLDELCMGEPNTGALNELYQKLEFRTWLAQLREKTPEETPIMEAPAAGFDRSGYDTILTQADFGNWLQQLEKAELFAFDTETTSLNYMDAEIVGVSFAVEAGKAAYIPLAHDYEGAPEQLDRKAVLDRLKPLLESTSHKKVLQHAKYDAHVLRNHGIELRGVAFDTMLESYVFNSVAGRHDMDSLAARYLNHTTIHFEDIAGKGAKQKRFDQIAVEDAGPYAAEDADITLRLHQHLWPELGKTPDLNAVFTDIEVPLIPVLTDIEHYGVLLDKQLLETQSTELAEKMAAIQAQAQDEAGGEFNLGSPKQLQEILFEQLGLPVIRKTPKGQPSTAEDVLEELAAQGHTLPNLILEHRGLAKLKSTYTDRLPALINAHSGRVHTSYHQAVAVTGRLSSADPNLQNIPVRTAEGRRIRQAFIAPPGYKLVAADYSQIELRIMAHLSGDKSLIAAFEADKDIHQATAAEVFGVAPGQVSTDQRRSAKAINFGLIYGMSAFGLARQLGIPRGEAQDYVDTYFNRYPQVKAFMDNTRESAREQGYVETVFGRRLYLPDIKARKAQLRQYAERTAINAPMQGTAADIIKRAMLAVAAWLEKEEAPARMIMQVHDELVFEVAENELAPVIEQLRQHMTTAAQLRVPLRVDVGSGNNWEEAH
ncbi:MAG TPA: DNA polymerase I [Gammaproteobacteria bacterium]|nr:DNA polymerase I [Gammaproteobacteria bacterium]